MLNLYPNRTVVSVIETAQPTQYKPLTAISIAVDTAYVASQSGRNISKGIYMMDNMKANGSQYEGTLELSTQCPVGSLIGFKVQPINSLGTSGDKVIITGFTVSQGNVFTAAGQPIAVSEDPSTPPDYTYWVGQALNTGSQTYQIQIKVTTGQLHPVSYFINWDPFITAQ
jgi:hypothetical protein